MRQRAIRAILWDNDGVLVDTERLYYEATRDVLAPLGIELTLEAYVSLLLVEARGAWHLAEAKGLSQDEIVLLRDQRNRRYSELLESAALTLPGVEAALERLHGHFVMGIVTSSRKDHFDIIHRRTGLLRFFAFAVTNADFAHSKPHPEPYQKGIERCGVAAEEAVAIEDSQRGLTSALRAGLSCYVVPTGLTSGCDFTGAARVCASVAEVADVLLGEGAA